MVTIQSMLSAVFKGNEASSMCGSRCFFDITIVFQRLLILYHAQHTQTDIILNWIRSQNDVNWRLTIVEALWTIKAKRVLQMVRTSG